MRHQCLANVFGNVDGRKRENTAALSELIVASTSSLFVM